MNNKTRCIVLILILLLPNFYFSYLGEDSIVANPLRIIVFNLVGFSYLLLGLVLIPPKLFFKLLLPILPFIFLESVHIQIFKSTSSIDMLITGINTNIQETMEFISGYYPFLVLNTIFSILYLFLLWKVPKAYRLSKKEKVIIVGAILFLHASLFVKDTLFMSKGTVTQRFDTASGDYSTRYQNTFPVNIGYKVMLYSQFQKRLNSYQHKTDGFSFNSQSEDQVPKTIVLVLGETARAANFSLNGYDRKTNPYLEKEPNLINFSQAYAGANLTQSSLPLILSRATPRHTEIAYEEKSMITAFQEQGYKVFWISNQTYGPSTPLLFYSQEADSLILNQLTIDSEDATDENLIEQFDFLLKNTHEQKRLFIIHTLGSHFKYNYRSPDRFKKYLPGMDRTFGLTNIKKEGKHKLMNSYDNSILFTDYFIQSCINLLYEMEGIATLTYLSDHGENLYDDERGLILHGTPEPTLYELHVPMFVWLSPNYQQHYPGKYTNLESRQSTLFSSVNLPYLQWGLANIRIDGSAGLDLSSNDYQEPDSIYAVSQSVFAFPREKLKY